MEVEGDGEALAPVLAHTHGLGVIVTTRSVTLVVWPPEPAPVKILPRLFTAARVLILSKSKGIDAFMPF